MSAETAANMAEYVYMKPAIIGVMVALNLLSNSLVIGVLLRYPLLREDRNALFILSMSFSDTGTALFDMIPSGALCSKASPFLLRNYPYLPTVIGVAMFWFSYVSMSSICLVIVSKNIAVVMPFRSEQLLSRTRCHVINGLTWLVGFCFAASLFFEDVTWSDGTCAYNFPINSTVTLYYQAVSLFTLFAPRLLLICGTVRITIVVMRTHRQIAAQAHSVADEVAAPNVTLTGKTLRSSINIIVICVVSIILTTPIVIYSLYVIHFNNTDFQPSSSSLYGFAVICMFKLNTVANSVLYLIIFRSVRKKTAAMLRDMLICIRRS